NFFSRGPGNRPRGAENGCMLPFNTAHDLGNGLAAGLSIDLTEPELKRLGPCVNEFPALAPEQAMEAIIRIDAQMKVAAGHLNKDRHEIHVRDLPFAFAAGTDMEIVDRNRLYELRGFKSTKEWAYACHGIKASQH